MNMRTTLFTPRWGRVFQAEGRANARPRGRSKLRALPGTQRMLVTLKMRRVGEMREEGSDRIKPHKPC